MPALRSPRSLPARSPARPALPQYDPRLKHFGMDEEIHSIDWAPATPPAGGRAGSEPMAKL